MLTKNFWSLLCGGGKDPNYTSEYACKVIGLDKTKHAMTRESGGISQILGGYCTIDTLDGLEYLVGRMSSYNPVTWYRFCYFDDNKNLSDSQIYTTEGDIGAGVINGAPKFRTIRSETTGNITGIKINFNYKNSTSNDNVFNTIKIINSYGSSQSNSYNFSTNQVVALVQLNETVTIKPEETYSFEYNIDNIFEDIPDTIV